MTNIASKSFSHFGSDSMIVVVVILGVGSGGLVVVMGVVVALVGSSSKQKSKYIRILVQSYQIAQRREYNKVSKRAY